MQCFGQFARPAPHSRSFEARSGSEQGARYLDSASRPTTLKSVGAHCCATRSPSCSIYVALARLKRRLKCGRSVALVLAERVTAASRYRILRWRGPDSSLRSVKSIRCISYALYFKQSTAPWLILNISFCPDQISVHTPVRAEVKYI